MTSKSTITPELLDALLANYEKPEDLTGDSGLFKQLKKALIERALGAELTEHLGYEKGSGGPRQRQQPQRLQRKDGSDRGWRGRDCRSTRPRRQLRAAADRQGPDPLRRFRRQDFEPICARHDGPRDPAPPRRTLCHRRLAPYGRMAKHISKHSIYADFQADVGGEGGIRTLGTVTRTTVFECAGKHPIPSRYVVWPSGNH
jgi:hypothetical protein